MKALALTFVLAAATLPATAQKVLSQQAVAKMVIETVSKFRDSISCAEDDIKPSDVFAMTPLKSDEEYFDARYVVLWQGDVGCNGGSGTMSSHIAVVTFGSSATPVVNLGQSSPVASIPLPMRGIERVVSATADTITVEAADFGPNDANCCPTIRSRYVVRLDDKGVWRVLRKQSLPPKK
jgi:LppP/LprE lipoprotein